MKPESPDLLRLREINETMPEVIKVSRDTIIEHLVQSDIEHFAMYPESLEAFFLKGFEGYENYSDQELVIEYRAYISEDEEVEIEIILENEK
jgi:hypothetical protein